ncbi:MAG: TAXI family TRAP transporter solute-binding subunit [Gammaproteobacteria bacterium]|nr:TAXI family TRAP transporter solute-binding subunit [Gammaproteobacteria bacterium]
MALSVGVARADSATIVTTSVGTGDHFYGLAIAKAADKFASLDLRPIPYKSQGQGAVVVNKGGAEFGLHNAIILREAYLGLEFYKGRRLENLRAVARLVPFQITIGVRGDSGIRTVEDLRGKRFPAGFDATSFGERLFGAMLRTGGLSYDDVISVRVSDWKARGKAFVAGKIDVNALIVGSPTATRYAQLVPGFRAVSLTRGPGVEERLNKVLPGSRLAVVEPAEGRAGIFESTVVLEYDKWLYAHKDTPDSKVTAVLKSLLQGKETLASVSKEFLKFDPAKMYVDIGMPFHPAAEAFYADHKMK